MRERSSTENNRMHDGIGCHTTITLSNSRLARRMMSSCPLVIGQSCRGRLRSLHSFSIFQRLFVGGDFGLAIR
jgi:hypothetical protein